MYSHYYISHLRDKIYGLSHPRGTFGEGGNCRKFANPLDHSLCELAHAALIYAIASTGKNLLTQRSYGSLFPESSEAIVIKSVGLKGVAYNKGSGTLVKPVICKVILPC